MQPTSLRSPAGLGLAVNRLVSRGTGTAHLEREEPGWSNLSWFHAVLVRKDPPFDTEYFQLTLILDHLDPGVTQFNDVSGEQV